MNQYTKIIDEFSSIPDRRVRYQLRHKAKGLCHYCSNPVLLDTSQCEKHLKQHRKHDRERRNWKRKYKNTKFTRAVKEQVAK